MKTEMARQSFEKFSNIKFHANLSCNTEVVKMNIGRWTS
jgi:hypothetical protein